MALALVPCKRILDGVAALVDAEADAAVLGPDRVGSGEGIEENVFFPPM
jgi:hypothetical protein